MTTTASASPVAGKPPTVLKIKLNTSPTTCETLTITSPPLRDNRHSSTTTTSTIVEKSIISSSSNVVVAAAAPFAKTLERPEYPAVTSIKIKPLIAPPSVQHATATRKGPDSPPTSTRDTRGSTADGGRKKRRSDEDKRNQTPTDEKKPRKTKTKKGGSSSQAVINNAAFVSEQATDLIGIQNFGWGSATILWESQLRIPSPLTVPFTVSFARRQANQLKERERNKSPKSTEETEGTRTDQDDFLEKNFNLSKQSNIAKQPHNRIWRKRRQVSPPPPQVKLPPPDFVMSATLEGVLKAIADDKIGDADPDESTIASTTATTSLPLQEPCPTPEEPPADRASDLERPTGVSHQLQTESEIFLDSMRLGASPSGDINADVFRMEFPVAAVERVSPASLLGSPSVGPAALVERSQSFGGASSTSCVLHHHHSHQKTVEPVRRHSSSSAEVKFSISSILSDVVGSSSSRTGDDEPPTQVEITQAKEPPNVQETIEVCITNLSRFFWALETCSERTRCRLAEVCLFKRPVLERILAIVRKLTIVVAPNQIERVLQLESAVEKYFLEPPVPRTAPVSLLTSPQDVVSLEPFLPIAPSEPFIEQAVLLQLDVERPLEQPNDSESLKGEVNMGCEDIRNTNDGSCSDNGPSGCNQHLESLCEPKDDSLVDDKGLVEVKHEPLNTYIPLETPLENKKSIDDVKSFCETDEKRPPVCVEGVDDHTSFSKLSPKGENHTQLPESDSQSKEDECKFYDTIRLEVSAKLNYIIAEVTRSLADAQVVTKRTAEAQQTFSAIPLKMEICCKDPVHKHEEKHPQQQDRQQELRPIEELAPTSTAVVEETESMITDDSEDVKLTPGVNAEVKSEPSCEILEMAPHPSAIVVDSNMDSADPYGFPGSFGYNMCKSLVPYVSNKRVIRLSYRAPEMLLSFRAVSIPKILTQSIVIPLLRGSLSIMKSSQPGPCTPTAKKSMELVVYERRSSDIMENLFHLAGLIPERVPIPLQVHDYILQTACSNRSAMTPAAKPLAASGVWPTTRKRARSSDAVVECNEHDDAGCGGQDDEDHSLFELIKRRALEMPSLPDTSPTFGDIHDMDVHRWEEVSVQGVQPPTSLGSALPGSLNVH